MTQETFSVRSHHGSKSTVEKAAEAIFTACGFFAVLAVASITLYMIFSGTPALFKVGILDILFGTLWQPAAAAPSFGILYVILTSIVGTFLAILIGVPVGVMTAVFLAEVAPKKLANVVRPAVELLAGIPSVIYGLLGILILNPLMYKIELAVFKGSFHSSVYRWCKPDLCSFSAGADDPSNSHQYQRICFKSGSVTFKKCFSGIRCYEDPDYFPGDPSGSKIRYYHSCCSGNRKSHR